MMVKEAVALALQNDDKLLKMLAPNASWKDRDNKKKRYYSVIPYEKFDPKKTALPAITIQGGDDSRVGNHTVETFLYIRCYNSKDKTFYDINRIIDRVKVVLHRKKLKLTDSVFVENTWENTLPELFDEGYDLPYRESRYKISRI